MFYVGITSVCRTAEDWFNVAKNIPCFLLGIELTPPQPVSSLMKIMAPWLIYVLDSREYLSLKIRRVWESANGPFLTFFPHPSLAFCFPCHHPISSFHHPYLIATALFLVFSSLVLMCPTHNCMTHILLLPLESCSPCCCSVAFHLLFCKLWTYFTTAVVTLALLDLSQNLSSCLFIGYLIVLTLALV